MTRTLLVALTGHRVGLTATSLGLIAALGRAGTAVGYAKPIAQPRTSEDDNSVALIRLTTRLKPPAPIPVEHAEQLLGEGRLDDLMEEVVAVMESLTGFDVVVVEGLVPSPDSVWSTRSGMAMAPRAARTGSPGRPRYRCRRAVEHRAPPRRAPLPGSGAAPHRLARPPPPPRCRRCLRAARAAHAGPPRDRRAGTPARQRERPLPPPDPPLHSAR
jgi:hypothetical protein